METTNQTKKNVKLERVLGIILLIPPVIGVLLFLLNLMDQNIGDIPEMKNLSSEWTGDADRGGGYTSAAPIYLGLMAIAGAFLLKGTDKK
jgi:hypothetical protein